MKLIVGLGNPGAEYERTRHNAGFLVIDRLVQRHPLGTAKTKFHALAWEGDIAGQRCLLLEPITYMNRSGLSVGEAMAFYKLPASDLLVIVDDIALPCGKIRLRPDGGPGGHNGLTDIQRVVGGPAYPRLRVGIDPPGPIPQRDYVLGRFTSEQWDQMQIALLTAVDAVECWISQGIQKAMNRYNGGE